MAQRSERYYRPYDSGDDSDSTDSTGSAGSTDSTGSTDSSDSWFNTNSGPNFVNFANILKKTTTIPSTISQDGSLSYIDLPLAPDPPKDSRYGETVFTTEVSRDTSIVLIDSFNRDKSAYPQPTQCTFRIPQSYRNVISISVAEIKLLTSFYFFSKTNGNTDITIYEQGRQSLYNGSLQSTIVKTHITEGSYTITDLLSEIQIKLNRVPLFFDYINGFNDFITQFRSSGDLSIIFNQPGSYFYNRIKDIYIPNPTIDTIVLYFWNSRYAGLNSYTTNDCIVAYYYPVLKENLTDTNTVNLSYGLNIDPSIQTEIDVYNRCVYISQGIQDPLILAVILGNIATLDQYRLNNTFRYSLINQYDVSYNKQSQHVTISSSGLNTSLINQINLQETKLLNQALSNYNLTRQKYINLQQTNSINNAILQSMYFFLEKQFLTYFAVPWSQYSLPYFMNNTNPILIRDGLNIVDVPSNDSEALQAGIVTYTSSIFSTGSNISYWPMSNLNSNTISYSNLLNISTNLNLNHVYSQVLNTIDLNQPFIDKNTFLPYSSKLTNTANVVCPIDPSKYTIFKIQSKYRQTIQIETLPLPVSYRLSNYNLLNYDSTINTYFNYPYSYASNIPYNTLQSGYTTKYDTILSANLNQVPGWTSSNSSTIWGFDYQSSLSLYEAPLRLNLISFNKAIYTQFTTPFVPNASLTSTYTYSINVTATFFNTLSLSTIETPLTDYKMFIYQDRGAFMGDITCNRTENPYFNKYSLHISTGSQDNTISFRTYPGQTYYVTLRPDLLIGFPASFVSIVPWFSTISTQSLSLSVNGLNPSSDVYLSSFSNLVNTNINYAQIYDSNLIPLPINVPYNSSFEVNVPSALSYIPIGYDTNDVSTDFTDYIPYVADSLAESFFPTGNFGIDPINKYIFNSNTPYLNNEYLYGSGNNLVMTPGLTEQYFPTTVSNREYKIVHYYSVNYIPESEYNIKYFDPSLINNSVDQLPYTIDTTNGQAIQGYKYAGSNSNIQFESGIMGFSFIPTKGVWNLKKLVFRTAISDSENDPNNNIAYIGVYLLQDVLDKDTKGISIFNSITVLSNSARVTYTSTFIDSAAGFDGKSGTYYEFKKDTSFTLKPAFSNILGYNQVPGNIVSQPESMYVCIPFTSNYLVYTIKALSGSAIPYPYYNKAFTSTSYIDGSKSYISSQGVVFPSTIGQTTWPSVSENFSLYAPNGPETQSQFATSIPIGTSVLLYKKQYNDFVGSNILNDWPINTIPTVINANVKSYMLMQDTQINIYKYSEYSPTDVFSNAIWNLTVDNIFSSKENTSLLGFTGNSARYFFLGLSNTSLRIKQFDPKIGELIEIPLHPSYTVPQIGTIKSFTINNYNQFVLAYQNKSNRTIFYYTRNDFTTTSLLSTNSVNGSAIHTSPSDLSTIFWYNADKNGIGSNTIYEWDITRTFPGKLWNTSNSVPSWNQIAVNSSNTSVANINRIFLTNTLSTSTVYYSTGWNTSNNISTLSFKVFPRDNFSLGTINCGHSGSIWFTDINNTRLWGNRNVEVDIPGDITGAWQLFYPFQKIVLERIDNFVYEPLNDLTNLDYPYYPHTKLFYYDSFVDFFNDTNKKWGVETSYVESDIKFSGYYYNARINAIPISKASILNAKYITVRGLTPTQSSKSLLRFIIPNKYTFGYVTPIDLMNEIKDNKVNSPEYDSGYIDTLSNFDNQFNQSNIFGANTINTFNGTTIITSNFQDFYTNMSTLYSETLLNNFLYSNITKYINTSLIQYIQNNLNYILPSNVLSRQHYTDPIIFNILWNSSLLPQYKKLVDSWGLGYNLGYKNMDTGFSLVHTSLSFYKILDDYIYLRINPEYNINTVDITDKENLNITRDSTGSIRQYFGKLLLGDFNTYSRTFIGNQFTFNPPIARLDKLSFEWLNSKGVVLNNNDCEWSASFAVTEYSVKQTIDSSIIKPVIISGPNNDVKPATN